MPAQHVPELQEYRFQNRPFYEVASDEECARLDEDSRADINNFRRNGYLELDSGIAAEELDLAAEYIRERCFEVDPISKKSTLKEQRVIDGWTKCDAILSIARTPRIMRKLEVLYGRRPFPFQTLNFPVGSQQRTHSDGIHFNTIPSRFMCGVWVALEDVTLDSGPLHYYAGSHHLPDTSLYETFDGNQASGSYPSLEDYNVCYEDYIECQLLQHNFERKEVSLRKGQAFIWSAGLCHGGSVVIDPASTRLSQVTHMFFDDCVYYSPRRSHNQVGRLWLRDVLDIQTGKRMEHVFSDQRINVQTPGPYRISETGQLIHDFTDSHGTSKNVGVIQQVSAKLRSIIDR